MAAADDDYTPREIARSLKRLEQAITDLRQEVSTLGFVRQDVWSVEREAIHERIEQVRLVAAADTGDVKGDLARTQENLRWLARGVILIVLTVILGAVLAAAGVSP
jgi:hypothetical protein